MKAVTTLLSLSLVASNGLAAMGSNGGRGGGGGICANGQCMTLAEAGIRVSANSPGEKLWYIPPTITSEINIIINELPFAKASIYEMTAGKLETFVEVNEVAPSLRTKIRKEYKETLRKIGQSSKFKNFAIFAISSSTKTYLLPEFFKLNSRQKALILIHEGIVRKTNGNFLKALEFDGLLLDHLKRDETPDYTPLPFINLLEELTGIENPEKNSDSVGNSTSATLSYVEKQIGRKLRFSDFFPHEITFIYEKRDYPLRDQVKQIRDGNNLMPEWFNVFGAAKVRLVSAGEETLIGFSDMELKEVCRGVDTTPVTTTFTMSWNNSCILVAYEPMTFVSCSELNKGKAHGIALKIEGLNKAGQ